MSNPYGVPTGYVPRVQKVDPIQQAVDDYLLMERKARAWDELRSALFPSERRVLALMDELVHPAQTDAPATKP